MGYIMVSDDDVYDDEFKQQRLDLVAYQRLW
jgi:hypothetical protein